MRRWWILASFLLLVHLPAVSQNTTVRVGVTPLQTSSKDVSIVRMQDRLIKLLNEQKPDKKTKVSVQAVLISREAGAGTVDEAKDRNCDFILTTHLLSATTSHVSSSDGAGGFSDQPVFEIRLEYRLTRIADGAPFAIGSFDTRDMSSVDSAVWGALGRIAHQAGADLEKGGNLTRAATKPQEATNSADSSGNVTFVPRACAWLPDTLSHREALAGVCEYAASLTKQMPNFLCDQNAARYRGNNKVPFDQVSAIVRYENGRESYESIKLNGRPAPDAGKQVPGLWSTGEFGDNLRSVFDLWNQPLFTFSREDMFDGHPAFVFGYRIVRQNDPLWRLHGDNEILAPPYVGEIWVDSKTGELLRFTSVATDIPQKFAMSAASIQIDYADVAFGDGSQFVLPADYAVSTTYHREEPTRNVVQYRNCHKFRAKTQILLNVASADSSAAGGADESVSTVSTPSDEIRENEELYAILREQAIRDDQAFLDQEERSQQDAATLRALSRLAALEKARVSLQRRMAAASTAPAPPVAPIETTLKVSVRLVPVTVVLRDPKGNAVGTLKKEDFELFDNGKSQEIKTFSIEESNHATLHAEAKPATTEPAQTVARPDRYIAYLFDDIHTAFEDLAATRDAAVRHLSQLQPADRVAIFTTSGQVTLDFTNDPAKLQQALKSLRTHPIARGTMCPPISEYMADEIVNQNNREVLGLATHDAVNCAFAGAASSAELMHAEQIARSTAMEVLSTASAENQSVLNVLYYVFQRTSSAPGRRSVVLVSPGFLMLAPEVREAIADLTNAALRSEIVVNTLDVRGLVTPMSPPNQAHPSNPVVRFRYDREGDSAQSEVLADLAYSTGGTFFHNNNDLNEGFRRTAERPEYVYVLGFSPQKLDGKYHKLKIRLTTTKKLTIQARDGYYALTANASR